MSTRELPDLRRLLEKREVEALLNAFVTAAPGLCLALVRSDGRLFAKTANLSDDALPTVLAVAAAAGGVEVQAGVYRCYPLLAESHRAGTLVAHRLAAADGEATDAQRAVEHAVHSSLAALMRQALEKRDVATEALERYREINLLYRLGETIGTLLDPEVLPRHVLQEGMRVIGADAGLVVSWAGGGEWDVQASTGDAQSVAVLNHWAGSALGQILPGRQPAILTGLADVLQCSAVLWAPLVMQEQTSGGILLARREGRPVFTAGDEKLLMSLARQAAIAMENARLHQAALQHERLEHELALAHQMQASLMPRSLPQVPGWDFAAWWQPARRVSGDFYDFIARDIETFRPSPTREGGERNVSTADPAGVPGQPGLGLVIADVSDKGMPAALFMVLTRSIVRASTHSARTPADGLTRANRLLCADATDGMFVTLFYAALDPARNEWTYVNAGHNPPLLLRGDEPEMIELGHTGIILGFDDQWQFEQSTIRLQAGDLLVLYTDGVVEATNAQHERFGDERLRDLIRAHRREPASALMQALRQTLGGFIGTAEPYDDITVVVAKCLAGGEVQAAASPPNAAHRLEIERAARLENLPHFREFVENACREAGIVADACFDLKLVVDEACTNIITYGYADMQPGPIRITFQAGARQVVLTIGDRARPFDPAQVQAPSLGGDWAERPVGGLGWHLIRQLVDEVHYQSDPAGGNLLTLIKRREGGPTPARAQE